MKCNLHPFHWVRRRLVHWRRMREARCHMACSWLSKECHSTVNSFGGGSCLPVTQGTKVSSRCSAARSSVWIKKKTKTSIWIWIRLWFLISRRISIIVLLNFQVFAFNSKLPRSWNLDPARKLDRVCIGAARIQSPPHADLWSHQIKCQITSRCFRKQSPFEHSVVGRRRRV